MSCAVGSGRVAEMPNTDMPEQGPGGLERGVGVGDEAGDRDVRRGVQAGELHRRPVALGPADVVVEDLVEAEAGRLDGQVDLVLAHLRAGRVAERRRAVVVGERGAATAVEDDHARGRPFSHAHFASTGSRKQTIRPMTRTPVACSSSSAWRASY